MRAPSLARFALSAAVIAGMLVIATGDASLAQSATPLPPQRPAKPTKKEQQTPAKQLFSSEKLP
ncbi:MAG TPA: hypothetical protein VG986_01530, partial [Pseudolabrys sp.]|nr:hypothetical protein [Pseudolabrys sp.]